MGLGVGRGLLPGRLYGGWSIAVVVVVAGAVSDVQVRRVRVVAVVVAVADVVVAVVLLRVVTVGWCGNGSLGHNGGTAVLMRGNRLPPRLLLAVRGLVRGGRLTMLRVLTPTTTPRRPPARTPTRPTPCSIMLVVSPWSRSS